MPRSSGAGSPIATVVFARYSLEARFWPCRSGVSKEITFSLIDANRMLFQSFRILWRGLFRRREDGQEEKIDGAPESRHVACRGARLKCFWHSSRTPVGVPAPLQKPKRSPTPSSVARPSSAKIAAAIRCTRRTGMRSAMRSPSRKAGTLAIIRPSVVPATTGTMA